MRMPVLLFLSFTVLAVTLAVNGPGPKKKAREIEKPSSSENKSTSNGSASKKKAQEIKNPSPEIVPPKKSKPVEKSSPETKKKVNGTDATLPNKIKKVSKSPPVKKPSMKKKKIDNDDLGIEENLADILKDDDENDVNIPSLDKITINNDPIALGQKIKKIANPEKRKELVETLRRARIQNRGTLPGKFYQAAYASLLSAQDASNFWNNQVHKEAENSADKMNKFTGIGSGLLGGAGLDDALGNARKLVQIDPLGIALRRGESALLTVLSDVAKNFGKITDMVYDAAGNTSTLIRGATPFVDRIPIASEIKNNAHDFVEEGLKRGKYLIGSFSDNQSEAFSRAAKDASKKADEKELLLRQFMSKRQL